MSTKEHKPFPGVICQRLRNLVKAEKEAKARRQDLFDTRDNAEQELNNTPTTNTKAREHHQAEYGRCVLEIKRWDKAITAICNDKNELIEKADEPGLFDEAEIHISEFMDRVAAPKKPKANGEEEDPDQTRIPGTEKDTRPVGRRPEAPVPVGEMQHLEASITELEEHGVKGEVCRRLVQDGYTKMGHVVVWFRDGADPKKLEKLNGSEPDRVVAGVKSFLKKHNQAITDKDLGRGDEPMRNTGGGPRVGKGAPVGKKDTKKGK